MALAESNQSIPIGVEDNSVESQTGEKDGEANSKGTSKATMKAISAVWQHFTKFDEALQDPVRGFDLLDWWKKNCARFPILSIMARDILAVPVSTVASESTFSTGGRVLDAYRSSLTPKIVESLICSQDWIRKAAHPLFIEEDIHDVEKLEKDLTAMGVSSACLID